MVRSSRKPRRCVVGDQIFFWSVGHEHHRDDAAPPVSRYQGCREVLTLRRCGTQGRLQIVFRQDVGRLVSGVYLSSGSVGTEDDVWLNLHEPGTVRGLLDEAIARGWNAGDHSTTQIDGWALFDIVARRREGTVRPGPAEPVPSSSPLTSTLMPEPSDETTSRAPSTSG